jgi:DNA mismatch endonuclease, patch repair protein
MADIVSHETRSRMMAGIQGKNTKAEITIRNALHRKGFRYRLYVKTLPSKPELVFPKYKAVILINGCFWHGHNCYLFKWPSTNSEFWQEKISGNKERDIKNKIELEKMGWRVLTIWECAFKGKNRLIFQDLIDQISKWLITNQNSCEIKYQNK